MFNYTISELFSESGFVSFDYVSGDLYVVTLGPYNRSFFMESNIFVNDSYGLEHFEQLEDVWYVFGGNDTCVVRYGTDDEILVLKQGWNLISVPFLANHTVRIVLEDLSNGNWGCGRDGGIPINCDNAWGDYQGNFTKVMGYNKSDGSWLTFNPTDYYLAIDDEELDDIDAKRGYWINMTNDQNLTLDLKYD